MALSPTWRKALNKAMEVNPRVERVSPREYRVTGSKGTRYTVTVKNGEPTCNCKARDICYHLAAAAMEIERRKLEHQAVDPEHAPLVNPVPRGRAGLGLAEVA